MAIFFKKVRWKNFLSTGNAFTEIDLASHKTSLIVGRNGAGKTSFIDAISYSLYGKPFRKINKPQLLNSINKKDLMTEIEFSINGVEYVIKRGMRPHVFEIIQNGQLLNQDAAVRDYQEYLEKHILNLSHKSFTQIVTLGSSTYVPFMQLPASARREFNEDLLDIGVFSTMFLILKDRIADNKSAIGEAKYQSDLNKEKVDMQKKHLRSLKVNNQSIIDSKHAKIEETKDTIRDLVAQNETWQYAVDGFTETIDDETHIQKRLKDVSLLLHKLKEKVHDDSIEVKFYENNDSCPKCMQGIDHDFKTHSIATLSGKIAQRTDALVTLEQEYEKASTRITEITTTQKWIMDNIKKISANNSQISVYERHVSSLEKEILGMAEEGSTPIQEEDAKLTTLEKEASELNKVVQFLIGEKTTLDIAYVLLKDSGIKAKIIKQYIPVMNKLINKYLSSMDFFVEFVLDENFNESIKSRYRDDFSYESFSEGEKMRIDMALMLCWRSIAKMRNSNSTNLLVMDEIFDGSLDGPGSEELMNILQNLVSDTNLFIISHKTDNISDKFDRTIRFEKVKNYSRIAE